MMRQKICTPVNQVALEGPYGPVEPNPTAQKQMPKFSSAENTPWKYVPDDASDVKAVMQSGRARERYDRQTSVLK